MDHFNGTFVTEFILLGFTNVPELQFALFGIFLIFYVVNMLGNLTIIVITVVDTHLHTPMYFFLSNLSLLDICFSSVPVPKMLVNFLAKKKTISFVACIAQLHFFHFLGSTEVLLLTAMSYDRYVAICNPLRYNRVMNRMVCLCLTTSLWTTGFLHSLLHSVMTSRLPFCKSNEINHYFCDIKPILKLACTNTHLNESLLLMVTGSLVMSCFLLTVLSYIYIGSSLIRVRSAEGRRKCFSTCSAHLTVVLMIYIPALLAYLTPTTNNFLEEDPAATLLFTVVTPMLNPFIYTLRNEDVKKALVKARNKWLYPKWIQK